MTVVVRSAVTSPAGFIVPVHRNIMPQHTDTGPTSPGLGAIKLENFIRQTFLSTPTL